MNGTHSAAFVRDLLAGVPATPARWRAYFNDFHAHGANPGRSHMRSLRDETGVGTMERLVSAVPANARELLDIGSGTGTLVPALRAHVPAAAYTGVDICASENERAQIAFGDERTHFVTADALALPFADASFDCIVSHFALMLIEPIEEAFAEVRRVLRSGGKLAFLIENRRSVQREHFAAMAAAYLRRTFPLMAPPVTNRDLRSVQALSERLNAGGFENVEARDIVFSAPLAPNDIADLVTSFYIYGSLDSVHLRELRELLLAAANTSADAAGYARYAMPATLFTATVPTHSQTIRKRTNVMTDTQQRAVVAGFLHVLTGSPDVYAQFQKIQSNPTEVGKFIAQTMNLKDHPSSDDLKKMADYADAHLAHHVEKLNTLHAGGVPKQCGNAFGLEHEENDH